MGHPALAYSQMQSHYYLTQKFLAAQFPVWPSTLLLRQPGHLWLPKVTHIDTKFSMDIRSP